MRWEEEGFLGEQIRDKPGGTGGLGRWRRRREDGGGGKDREVLGATVRGQRGAGWQKEEGAGRELES